MATKIIVGVALALALSGCSHVHRVDPAASGPELDDLNRTLEHRGVSVEAAAGMSGGAGAVFPAERVRVAPDSTFMTLLLDPREVEALVSQPIYGARRDTVLSTSAIGRMTTTNRFRGVLDGAVVGIGVGAALGALVGVLGEFTGAWLSIGENALFFGMVGSVVGTASGAMRGSREIYDFAGR